MDYDKLLSDLRKEYALYPSKREIIKRQARAIQIAKEKSKVDKR